MAHPKNIVIYSTADWNNPFWTNKQHTARLLAQRGYRVLYIESLGLRQPTLKKKDLSRIFKRVGSFFKGPRQVEPNLWVYSPIVIPLHRLDWVKALNDSVLRASIAAIRTALGMRQHVAWTYNPLTWRLLSSQHPELVVYHNVDDLKAAPGLPSEQIRIHEQELVRNCDLVFTTSPTLYEQCRAIAHDRCHFFPNVADFEHFSKATLEATPIPADLAAIPAPRLGFIGAISSYKVDFRLIAEVARRCPDWNWVLIGQVGEGQPDTDPSLLSAPNIHLLGPRPYDELPSYIKGFDVCTIPCVLNDYTASMFPMKFFEYLAASKPVVASKLPSLRDFQAIHLQANAAEEFIQACERLLHEPPAATTSQMIAQGRETAREHTWEKRLDAMLSLLVSSGTGKH